eukprot:1343290-Prymnesium_polylepis.1
MELEEGPLRVSIDEMVARLRTASKFPGFDVVFLERTATLLLQATGWKLQESRPPREVFFMGDLSEAEALFIDGKCLPMIDSSTRAAAGGAPSHSGGKTRRSRAEVEAAWRALVEKGLALDADERIFESCREIDLICVACNFLYVAKGGAGGVRYPTCTPPTHHRPPLHRPQR